jgi:hypothetical protein
MNEAMLLVFALRRGRKRTGRSKQVFRTCTGSLQQRTKRNIFEIISRPDKGRILRTDIMKLTWRIEGALGK